MSSDDLERRINNKIEALVEVQANLHAAIAELLKVERIQNTRIEESRQQLVALIEVARSHDERLDRIEKQQEKNSREIAALIEQRKETREDMKQMQDAINALIRIVEGHISNHP